MDSVFNRIGEWNPQLLRELKGRLKAPPLFLAIVAAVLLQGLLILVATEYDYIGQEFAWSVIFSSLGWILPLTLWICGVFLLTSDMAKEVRKGTLNFIRFSPQESKNILWGKVLGVPIIVYCFTLLCLPLHAWAGLQEYSLVSLLALYSLWGLGCGVCYTLALLFGMIGNDKIGEQARAGSASVLSLMVMPYYLQGVNWCLDQYAWGKAEYFDGYWFNFPFSSAWVGYGLTMVTGMAIAYWMAQIVNRVYQNPLGTRVSKSQSYWMVGLLQVWLLGFALPVSWDYPDQGFYMLFGISLFNLMVVLLMGFAMTPERQNCLDWARYRHQQPKNNRGLIQDLLWGEKSPSVGAIALQVLMITLVWVVWAIARLPHPERTWGVFSLILSANLMLIYGVIIQLSLLNRSKRRMAIAGSLVIAGLVLPLIIVGMLELSPEMGATWWMFSIFGGAWFALEQTAQTLVLPFAFSLLTQWALFAALNTTLVSRLNKMGQSTTKALMS
ncbi:hypothetical protein [Roseofilum capinflatum]|uniref:ABC transporter permease n=1 Tax=Roseofilum capinflatum BLCC-M114 TaxID=3022440 RepID=A0ABT7B4X9_9CYAN|nr:hypothetical protein [Roseofilum capinflatum]MDJ1174237.1 hypothetical protein [Roseofilum capinflatum BLCC-M114]